MAYNAPMSGTLASGRILVTGATGFIGGHLCARLHAAGHEVRAAVRRPAVLPAGCQHSLVGEIGPSTDWAPALADVEAVVHLASYSPAAHASATEQAEAYRRINIEGSIRLARAAAAAGVRRLIYLSTVKVNGEETALDAPFTAESPPQPQNVYGRSKWEAEQRLLQERAGGSAPELIILRVPLVYGPGVRDNFLALLRLVERGVPAPLACVRNRRSMLYVKSLADAIARTLAAPRWPARTYLLSDGEDLSTPELIRRIAAQMARPARLWPVPVPLLKAAGRLSGRRGMIERLTGSLTVDSRPFREDYGWSPPFRVDMGLRETVGWYRERREVAQ